MAPSYPTGRAFHNDFHPAIFDIARTSDLVAIGRTEEQVVLSSWAGANVQTTELTRDDVGDGVSAAFLDWRGGSLNGDINLVGVDPTFERRVENVDPLPGLISCCEHLGSGLDASCFFEAGPRT